MNVEKALSYFHDSCPIKQVRSWAKFEPDAFCPLRKESLGHVFGGDGILPDIFKHCSVTTLAGIADEHILPICFGDGNDGKPTIWNAFNDLLGSAHFT